MRCRLLHWSKSFHKRRLTCRLLQTPRDTEHAREAAVSSQTVNSKRDVEVTCRKCRAEQTGHNQNLIRKKKGGKNQLKLWSLLSASLPQLLNLFTVNYPCRCRHITVPSAHTNTAQLQQHMQQHHGHCFGSDCVVCHSWGSA